MTRWWIAGMAAALAACSGGGGKEDGGAADPTALVAVARAEAGSVAATTTLYGAAEALPSARIALVAPAEGVIAVVEAPPGTPVRAGQVVARLVPSPATRVDLAKAEADARAADLALARAQRLRADGLGSTAEVETEQAAARSADLTRGSLAARAGGLVVRAPAAGIVDAVAPSPGELIQPGGAIATIIRSGEVRARFGVDPTTARTLRAGAPITIEGNAGRPALTVPVESVSPALDPQTRLASLFARIPAGSGIAAGQTLSATVPIAGGGGVAVPYAALLDDAGQPFVFVVSGGVAHRRDVTVGAAQGGRVALAGGVRSGEAVVVEGGTAVEDGMKVRTH